MKTGIATLFLFAALTTGGCTASRPSRTAAMPQTPSIMAAMPANATTASQNQDQLYLNVIGGLVEQRQYGAVLAFLQDYALKHSDLTPRYWVLRGDALLGLGRGDEAASAYARLDKTDLAADGWNGKGQVAASARRWKDAEANFDRAVHMRPADAQFLNNMAFAEIQLGNGVSAAFHLRQAHELDPSSSLIRTNLILALNLSGDAAAADQVLAEIKNPGERDTVRAFVHGKIASTGAAGGLKS